MKNTNKKERFAREQLQMECEDSPRIRERKGREEKDKGLEHVRKECKGGDKGRHFCRGLIFVRDLRNKRQVSDIERQTPVGAL